MNITACHLNKSPNPAKAKELYISAFPKYERLPWWVLRLLTLNKNANITCYYDEEQFCGFTYDVTTDSILFLMFFAVNDELRGKGYGSAILEYLKKNHPDKAVTLNVEPIDPTAENAHERVRRIEFYKKNGFFDTNHNIDEVGGTFRVLSTKMELDKEAYLKAFTGITLGLWRPKITKLDNN